MAREDLAIKFQGLKQKIESMIQQLEEIGIDMNFYKDRFNKIINDSENNAMNNYSSNSKYLELDSYMTPGVVTNSIEMPYASGINKLESLKDELSNYNIYLKTYYACKSMESSLNDTSKITQQEINLLADNVINALNNISYSGTIVYSSERKIVEGLYEVAYRVIKLEMFYIGKSKVLEFIKSNNTFESYISSEVRRDIRDLDESNIADSEIKSLIIDSYQEGFDAKLLSDELIFWLSLKDKDNNLEIIYDKLLSIYNQVKELKEKMKNNDKELSKMPALYVEKGKRHRSFGKTLGSTLVLLGYIGGTVGTIFGGIKVSKASSEIRQYKTYYDVYSTGNTTQYDDFSEYTPELSDYNQTIIVEYGPWKESSGSYYRDVRQSRPIDKNFNYDDLSNYLKIPNENITWDSIVGEFRDKLSIDDSYDETIREVVKMFQDPDEYIVDYEPALLIGYSIFMSLMFLFVYNALWTITAIFDFSDDPDPLNFKAIKYIRDYIKTRKSTKLSNEEKKKLHEEYILKLEAQKRFLNQHEVLKTQFLNMCNKYAAVLNESELESRGISRKLIMAPVGNNKEEE